MANNNSYNGLLFDNDNTNKFSELKVKCLFKSNLAFVEKKKKKTLRNFSDPIRGRVLQKIKTRESG